MFCKNCGKEILNLGSFCPECGTSQSGSNADRVNWLGIWQNAYERSVDKFENGREGGSTKIVGSCVSITYDYYTGISAATKSLLEALGKFFLLVPNMETNSEIIKAVQTISMDTKSLSNKILSMIDNEYARMTREISIYCSNTESNNRLQMVNQNIKVRQAHIAHLDVVTKYFNGELAVIQENCCKRYWLEHKDERQKLDAEREALQSQIDQLNEQIEQTPKNTEGYSAMISCENKVKQLLCEKSKLGLFKLKEKKAIKTQIKELNKNICVVKERIKSGIEKIENLKTPLTNKIHEIDQQIKTPIVLL